MQCKRTVHEANSNTGDSDAENTEDDKQTSKQWKYRTTVDISLRVWNTCI